LVKQHNEHTTQSDAKRQERAQRILDAAAELVRRWGYGKTTIDDIARQAGVAKGTIYLHWKTREDLFRALMIREEQTLANDIKQRIANDPQGTTLHSMLKHMLLAMLKNPLMKAAFLGDTLMLGEMARTRHGSRRSIERLTSFNDYFEALRSQGLIRTDIGLKEGAYVISAIAIGFLLVNPLLPDEAKIPDEEAVELMAETIRRTFEPDKPAPPEALQAASHALDQYLDHTLEGMREASRQEMERE